MPQSANGKPVDNTTKTEPEKWQDDDSLSYTSGSSYSYTASSASEDEGPSKKADIPNQNGADTNDKKDVVVNSDIQPEEAKPVDLHTESVPKQTDWVDDVREDYNMMDLARRSHPETEKANEPEKDNEADKRSWLDSDSEESYNAGGFSSDSDNEFAGEEPSTVEVPGPVAVVAPSLSPASTPSPSPPPPDKNVQMHSLMGDTAQERDTEPVIQAMSISVVSAVPQEADVALDTIAEESQSKYASTSEGSFGEVRSQEKKAEVEQPTVVQQNIPVGEPVRRNISEPKRNSLNKKSSLLSSTVVADEKSLFEMHYRTLEEESDQVALATVVLPPKSAEKSAPPRRDDNDVDKMGNIEYVWDDVNCGTHMIVSEDSPKECHRKRAIQATDAARGKYDLIGGVHVFRLMFNDKPYGSHCSIGVCLDDAELSREGYGPVIGKDEFGWAWDIPSRMLVHDNKNCGFYPRVDHQQFIHTTIIMEVNLDEGKLRYMMEGVDLGIGFEGLPTDEPVYPAVTLVYGNAGVTIDLLQSSDKRFKVTPGGVPPLLPLEEPETVTSTEDGTRIEDAGSSSSSDEENDAEPFAVAVAAGSIEESSSKQRPQIEREKTDSFVAVMNMVPAKEEMTLLRAFDKNTINGFGLNVVPNDPFTCRQRIMPSPTSSPVYPSIGSTVPLETGVHMWHVQLRREYNGNIKLRDGENIESAFSSLNPCIYIGVVNDKYKRQNMPDSSGLDENSWAWNPIQEMLYHNDKSKQYPQTKHSPKIPPKLTRRNSRRQSLRRNVPNMSEPESSDEEGNIKTNINTQWNKAQTESGINLFRGVRVTLDMVQGILCYSYHDGHSWKNLGVAWNDLKGRKLYPHVWLHNANFAVTLRYLAGNKELMDKPVDSDIANKVKDASFMKAPSFDPRVLPMYRAPENLQRNFVWNPQDCSAGITFRPLSARQKANNFKICERDNRVPAGQQDVVRCASGFGNGVHVWLITFDSDEVEVDDQYVIGFGTKRAVAAPITTSMSLKGAVPSVLGGDFYSWGWDLKYHLLYHGEETRGEYPLLEPDFNWSDFSHFKLTLNCQSGTVHVDAYSRTDSNQCHRLGVMFNDLPKNVEFYPMFGYVKGCSPVMIEYIATSDVEGQLRQGGGKQNSSAMCTVL